MLTRLKEITPEAEKILAGAGDSLEWSRVRGSILAGHSSLYSLPIGYLVLRLQGTELFILAAAGKNGEALMEVCRRIAVANGCTHIRFQTARKGLPRLLRNFNPVEVARVFTVQVQNAN